MALRKIVTKEDPILHKKSREITAFDDRLHTLLDDMAESMREVNGVGLAAVQIGVLRRAVVIEIGDTLYELINPEIVSTSEEEQCGPEGCLSFPEEQGTVIRPLEVTVKALDRNGSPVEHSGEGLLARAFCHEIDHVNGVVFVERLASDEEIEAWEAVNGVMEDDYDDFDDEYDDDELLEDDSDEND